MNWFEYIIQAILTAVFVTLFFILKNYLSSYFIEKGKNVATKQDVSKITELVETVKSSFLSETEKLKSTLLVGANVKIGIATEVRNAIIDYNEKYFRWLNLLKTLERPTEIDKLVKYGELVDQSYDDLCQSETRFRLFIEDKKLVSTGMKLKLRTLELFSYLIREYIGKCIKHQEDKEYLNKLYSIYCYKSVDNYNIIVSDIEVFLQLCRNHIKQSTSDPTD